MADAHLMSRLLPRESPVVRVPEANAAVAGGADAHVTLAFVPTEGKAQNQIFMADELT